MTRPAFTDRVAARTSLARALQLEKYAELIKRVGLQPGDLRLIETTGEQARENDRKQREHLASQHQAIQELAAANEQFEAEAEQLRSRVPAVIVDLRSSEATAPLATWLSAASYRRFRVRELPPARAGSVEAPEKPTRKWVPRADRMARAEAISNFSTSLLSPERAPIVDALSRRGFSRERLEALAKVASDVHDNQGAKGAMVPSPYTALEAEAVTAQRKYWGTYWRMIRRVVEAAPELGRIWELCCDRGPARAK